MRKIKKNIKNNFKSSATGAIIGILLCTTIGVFASAVFPSNSVTYDNKNSGLSSNNVQGAIDELYNECFSSESLGTGDTILDEEPIVTTGDGLYKDEYEDRYFYRGKSVNNYITFNNETWRILSIEPDKTIKIISHESIGNMAWDSTGGFNGSNDWSRPANLNRDLNVDYYYSLTYNAQNQIVANDWSIGAVTDGNNNLEDQINDENSRQWNGKIALATASEFIRSHSNQSSCGTFNQINTNFSICSTTTWMFTSDSWWTLSPKAGYDYYVFYLSLGYGTLNDTKVQSSAAVHPVVTLSPSVKITGGTGAESSPYQISM